MKIFACSAAVLAAAIALAAAKFDLGGAPKQGEASKLQLSITLNVGGMEAVATTVAERKVVKVGEKDFEVETELADFKATVDGNDAPVPPPGTLKTRFDTAGNLQKAEGGIDGLDMGRMVLAWSLVKPGKSVEKGETWTIEADAAGSLPKRTVKGEYLGTEKIADRELHKVKQTLTEQGGEQFSATTTFWLTDEGAIYRLKSEFKNLPVPIAGASADGTINGEMVPSAAR